ncbi:MAG: hypothetical protein J2P58_16105 [Acidimicrobiaceae bacterium]|nr:hypothetical protein [Acidimicrobiaceae bacterium]MBO0747751.1 hypothetical protein [Acidimicrobiaceae bacterium]
MSRQPATAAAITSVLAGWRQGSDAPAALWSDHADRNLIRALLEESDDLTVAVHRFAEALADAGGTLAECCAHLAALERIVQFPVSAWELAPLVAEVFYGALHEQGVDPLTGLMTGPSLHAVLRARQQRLDNLGSPPDGWELLAVVTDRPKDSADALEAEMGTAEVLVATLEQAEAIGHVGVGRFVAIVETDHADARCERLAAALAVRGITASVRREALAATDETARSQLECLVTPRSG